MQGNSKVSPSIQTIGPQHAIEKQNRYSKQDIVKNVFPLADNKWNGVFKKNKVKDYDINKPPEIIQYAFKQCKRKAGEIMNNPEHTEGQGHP